MKNTINIIVNENENGLRIDSFISKKEKTNAPQGLIRIFQKVVMLAESQVLNQSEL